MPRTHFYTGDWFTSKIPKWETYLEDLKGKEGLRFLEIGCWEGRSTCWLLQNILTHPTCTMTCVDPLPLFTKEQIQHCAASWGLQPPFPDSFDSKAIFLSNIDVIGAIDKLIFHHGKSEDVLPFLPKDHYDFIYIDGSHYAPDVLSDAILSWRLLRTEGMLIFDDYELQTKKHMYENPKTGIDAFLSTFRDRYEIIDKGWQVVLRKIR